MELSDEAREFRDMLRRFFDESVPISEVRRVMESSATGDGVAHDLWKRACGELGLAGIAIPEEAGGQGFGLHELSMALAEAGRALAPLPLFASAALAGRAVAAVATRAQARRWLEPIAAGEIATLAWVGDRSAGDASLSEWAPEATSLEFVERDGRFAVRGEARYVVDGLAAERIFAIARRADTRGRAGLALFAIDPNAAGLEREAVQALDLTRRLATLRFDEVECELVGELPARDDPNRNGDRLGQALAEATALLCAEMVGAMQKVLETALDYAKDRYQFGRPIGSFQAIKHKCADMLIDFERARTLSAAATDSLESGAADGALLASVAKAHCGPAFERLATENVQIHGGVGYTWEYDAHLFFRRAFASQILLGDVRTQREVLARALARADREELDASHQREDTAAEAAFRAEARAWLEANARLRSEEEGLRTSAHGEEEEAEAFAQSIEWQRTLCEGGWAAITWPKEHGGRGATPAQALIFAEEAGRFDRFTGFLDASIGLIGPALMRFGTPEQCQRFLPAMLHADEVWCQLFSEPEAGSDLAAVRTRAVLEGDEFIVNGQKVWTTSAQYADYGFLLARTNPDVPKHQGISFLLIDMRQPGVEVRPLVTMRGDRHFNEVFFNDARVPAANVVNGIDAGWPVATFVLMHEGANIGTSSAFRTGTVDLAQAAIANGRFEDSALRQRLAEAFVEERALELLQNRLRTAILDGRAPDVDGSVLKILWAEGGFRKAQIALEVQGPGALLAGPEAADGGFWQDWLLGRSQGTVGGGTSEVHRNGLGERALGLPREPRLDRDQPFRELKISGN